MARHRPSSQSALKNEDNCADMKRAALIRAEREAEVDALMNEDRGGRSHFAPLKSAQVERPITKMPRRRIAKWSAPSGRRYSGPQVA